MIACNPISLHFFRLTHPHHHNRYRNFKRPFRLLNHLYNGNPIPIVLTISHSTSSFSQFSYSAISLPTWQTTPPTPVKFLSSTVNPVTTAHLNSLNPYLRGSSSIQSTLHRMSNFRLLKLPQQILFLLEVSLRATKLPLPRLKAPFLNPVHLPLLVVNQNQVTASLVFLTDLHLLYRLRVLVVLLPSLPPILSKFIIFFAQHSQFTQSHSPSSPSDSKNESIRIHPDLNYLYHRMDASLSRLPPYFSP